jgi:hypothetical protein
MSKIAVVSGAGLSAEVAFRHLEIQGYSLWIGKASEKIPKLVEVLGMHPVFANLSG